jgi:hypothetical protein
MNLAILTCDEIRAAEAMAVESGISLWALMRKAGQACADVLHAEFPDGRVIVLAGPGNNGGMLMSPRAGCETSGGMSGYSISPREPSVRTRG